MMTENTLLQALIVEKINRYQRRNVPVKTLLKVVAECHPMANIDEREALLEFAFKQLEPRKLFSFPDRFNVGAWEGKNRLPVWIEKTGSATLNAGRPGADSIYSRSELLNLDWENCNKQTLKQLRDRAPWVGKMLSIGPGLPLKSDQIRKALLINDYLRYRQDDTQSIPVRERALAIFGYEKELDATVKKNLFNKRMTIEELDCFYVPEPLQVVRIPEPFCNGPILIVENSTTFWSAWQANNRVPKYSAVIYGRGKMLKGSELATSSLEEVRQECADRGGMTALPQLHYYGDVDPEGFEIALSVHQQRLEAGLEGLYPAYQLYAALIRSPSQTEEHPWPKQLIKDDLVEWLGSDLASSIVPTMQEGRRWAQEGTGKSQMLALDGY